MALNDDGSLGNEFVLVLQGKQGIGKTSFFRKLAVYPEWFREGANIDMQNKDSIMEATNVLIAELGELEATINRQQPSLKAFLTRTFDTFRAPMLIALNLMNAELLSVLPSTMNSSCAMKQVAGGSLLSLLLRLINDSFMNT